MNGRGLRRCATLALAALAVSCASSKGTVALAENPVEQDVDVRLSLKGETCGIQKGDVRPESLPAKRGRRDKVKWHIYNHNCGTLNEVKIVFDDSDAHPFDNTCTKVVTNLEAGRTKTAKCQVRSNATDKKHYYKVYINGKPAIDPDIEIWP